MKVYLIWYLDPTLGTRYALGGIYASRESAEKELNALLEDGAQDGYINEEEVWE